MKTSNIDTRSWKREVNCCLLSNFYHLSIKPSTQTTTSEYGNLSPYIDITSPGHYYYGHQMASVTKT